MHRISFFLLFFMFATLSAQSTLTGSLRDADDKPVAFANVLLLSATDSRFVTGSLTDDGGDFTLIATDGDYLVSVAALGYPTYYGEAFTLSGDRTLPTYRLGGGGVDLAEVTVTAEQPLLVRRIDRTVVNVENQPTAAGLSGLELLERSPGVFINRQTGAISMAGKDGVNVLVNGRLNYINAGGLTDFLASLSADNVKAIELITTPPANFDAEGNAGFINIILKQLPDEGLNGNYNLTTGYARGGPQLRGGVNVNYRKNSLGFFAGYDVNYFRIDQETRLRRTTGSAAETTLRSDREPRRFVNTARLGLDYQLTDNTVVGGLVSGYVNDWDMDALSTTRFRRPAAPDTNVVSVNRELNDWRHLRTNLNLRRTLTGGATLTVDLDRLWYDNDNDVTYDERRTSEGFAAEQLLRSDKASPFTINVGEVNFTSARGGKVNYALGGKIIRSDFENEVGIFRDEVRDVPLSSFSELTEFVYAAYATADLTLTEKTTLKAGLRYEYSDTRLDDRDRGQLVDRRFGTLFPTFYLSRQLTDRQQLILSYGRRITRPAFTDMAPFVIFLDPRTLTGGDPTLQPAISNVYELGYRNGAVNATLSYTAEDSTIVNFQNRFDPALGFQRIVPDNLREQRTLAISLSFPVPLGKAVTARFSPLLTYRETVNDVEGAVITLDQFGYQLNGSLDVRLPGDYQLQLGGFYRGEQLNGNVVFAPTGILNVGLARQLKQGGRLALNVGDVFNSLYFEGRTDSAQPTFDVTRRFDFSQRSVTLTYSAPFGKRGVRATKERAAEEAGRIQN